MNYNIFVKMLKYLFSCAQFKMKIVARRKHVDFDYQSISF